MRTRNRSFGAVAATLALAAGLTQFGVSAPAYGATVTYTDNFCSQFFTVPGAAPGDVMLRCVKAMTCGIAPVGTGYIVPTGTTVTLQATCTAPNAQSYSWATGILSPQGCPAPQPVAGDPTKVTVMSATSRTCWYEVIGGDSASLPSPNMGTARYGIAWTDPAPTCTPTATPANLPAASGLVTLTGNCAGAATSWTWTRGGTTVGTNAVNSSDTPPANATGSAVGYQYALNACNGISCTGPIAAGTVTLAAAPVPSGCSISTTPANGQVPSSGGNIQMAVSCTGGGPFTAYNWHKPAGGSNFGTGTSNQSDTLPANGGAAPVQYSYDVQVCNAAGCAAAVSTTFTVAGTVASGLCGQYPAVETVNLPWPPAGDTIHTQDGGGFTGNGVFVGVIQLPANATSATQLGQINWGEFGDPPANRIVTVSTQACDFRTASWNGGNFQIDSTTATAPLMWLQGQTGGVIYSIGTQTASASGQPKLQAGVTYYFNVINKDILGNNTCGGSTCNMVIQHRAPH